jgi:uncharacterized repeat protein (TIGR01451 family)
LLIKLKITNTAVFAAMNFCGRSMTKNKQYVPTLVIAICVLFGSCGFAQETAMPTMVGAQPLMSEGHPAGPETSAERHDLFQMIAKAPMSFEANQGQTDKRVKFLSRGAGYTLFLTPQGAVMALQNVATTGAPVVQSAHADGSETLVLGGPVSEMGQTRPSEAVLSLKVVGANPQARVRGLNKQDAKSNYFIGNDPKKWHTHVPNYSRVEYAGVYPGVDLVYYGNQQQLEYDFVLAPQADPRVIELALGSGANGSGQIPVGIENGELVAQLEAGAVRFQKPVIYQTDALHKKTFIDGHYVMKSNGHVGFDIAEYDRSRKLVIDPTLTFATYLGGSNEEVSLGLTIGVRFGYIIIAGSTRSADFPVVGQLENYHPGTCGSQPCRDVFLSKFNPNGASLFYSTYIGGSNDDVAYAVTQDQYGDLFGAGYTLSTDFPVTANARQKTFGGGVVTGDGFAFYTDSRGDKFTYCTYVGGSGEDQIFSEVVDTNLNAYLVGYTSSSDFKTSPNAYQKTCPLTRGGTCSTAFITKLSGSGSGAVYSTFLGGSNGLGEAAYGVAIDSAFNAYITGVTGSANFPATPMAYDGTCGTDGQCNGNFDGFLAVLNTAGTALNYATFLGGSGADYSAGVALDSLNNIYVSGGTVSTNFPTTAGAGQKVFGGQTAGCVLGVGNPCGDVTVTKFSNKGALVYSTYLGGSKDEAPGISMAMDTTGNAYVTGTTSSLNFPLVSPFQTTFGGGPTDAFLTKITPTGGFAYSSYLGGNGLDVGYRTATDASGAVYVTGTTLSTNFPVTSLAFQKKCGTDGTCNGGLSDAWVAKVVSSADLSVTNTGPSTVTTGGTITYTITLKNMGPETATSVVLNDTTPTGTTFASVSTSNGTCTAPPVGQTGTVSCTLLTQPRGAKFTVTLVVNVTATSGNIIDTATATSAVFDPNVSNNSASVTTTVN